MIDYVNPPEGGFLLSTKLSGFWLQNVLFVSFGPGICCEMLISPLIRRYQMEKLIENKSFYLCMIYICSFMSNGPVSDLWDGIQHGLDAVLAAKGV